MKLEVLLGGLKNPNPAVRLDVVRVLGMLDEVQALEALRAHYQHETDPTVRNAVAWAGKRLYQARQAGYSTIDELFRFFGIDRELENTPDAVEAELVQRMQTDFDMDMTMMKTRANRRQVGMAAATGLGLGLVAGATVGLSAAMGGLAAGAGVASSNLGNDNRPQIGKQRTPPSAPQNVDISVWLRRLQNSANPDQREQAAIELSNLNNPAALPHLATAFISDSAPKVRQAAQRFGKILYWRTVYWEMEQDGSLHQEMARRLVEMGKRASAASPPDAASAPSPAASEAPTARPASQPADSPPASPPTDVSDILRKAQKGRAERKKKPGF